MRKLLVGISSVLAGCAVPQAVTDQARDATPGSGADGSGSAAGARSGDGSGGAGAPGTGGAGASGTGGTGGTVGTAGTSGSGGSTGGTAGSSGSGGSTGGTAGSAGSGGGSAGTGGSTGGTAGSGGTAGTGGTGGTGGCSLQREPSDDAACADCMEDQCCQVAEQCDAGTPCGLLTDCVFSRCAGLSINDCLVLYCSAEGTNPAIAAWNARADCLNGVCESDCGVGGGGSCQTTVSYGIPACDTCMQDSCCPELQACQPDSGCACLLTGGSFCTLGPDSFSLYSTANSCEFDNCFSECF